MIRPRKKKNHISEVHTIKLSTIGKKKSTIILKILHTFLHKKSTTTKKTRILENLGGSDTIQSGFGRISVHLGLRVGFGKISGNIENMNVNIFVHNFSTMQTVPLFILFDLVHL